MKSLFVSLILLFALAGCSTLPSQPITFEDSLADGYVLVKTAAEGVEIAKRDGHIDAERRDELVNQLQIALDSLRYAEQVRGLNLADATTSLQSAQALLRGVEAALIEAKAHE